MQVMADTHFKLQDGLLEAALARPSQPVQAGSALPRDAHVAVLRDVRAFLALEDQWRGLEAQSSPRRNVFQSFGWLKSWALPAQMRRKLPSYFIRPIKARALASVIRHVRIWKIRPSCLSCSTPRASMLS